MLAPERRQQAGFGGAARHNYAPQSSWDEALATARSIHNRHG
jgi:hypothetical protein